MRGSSADALLFRAFVENSQKKLIEAQLAFAEQQSLLETSYYESVQKKSEEVRRLRHDFNNQLQTIYSLHHKEYGDAAPFPVEAVSAEQVIPEYCQYAVLNAVLEGKRKKALELGIEMEIQVALTPDIRIKKNEICSLFSNLLDNAMETAGRNPVLSDEKILVYANMDETLIIIRVENWFHGTLLYDGGNLRTRKAGQDRHGLGLSIASSIAKKYGGQYTATHTGHYFIARVTLDR